MTHSIQGRKVQKECKDRACLVVFGTGHKSELPRSSKKVCIEKVEQDTAFVF